jgi:DNA-binding winged helix-turn-helix (wHTH) protein
MEANGLNRGFRLGAWLIEPGEARVSTGSVAFIVPADHMEVLLCLAESKGEFVDRRTLLSRAYRGQPGADQKLREAITAWHAVFGDTPQHPRYIDAAGRDGYSLIARCEPVRRMPIPERLVAASLRSRRVHGTNWTPVSCAHHLLVELRRRSVFRVAASYLVAMWILLQVAEVTFAPLHLPTWWITALTILAIVGMPIIVVLAWTYEITSDGVVRDSADAAASILLPRSRRVVAPAIIGGVVLMAAVTGYAWLESIG